MSLIMSYQGGQLTGDDINFEDFKLSEALCDAEQLTFGSCIASKIKFTISNQTESLSRKDMTVVLNGTQLGIFRAYDDVPDANSFYRTVTAYDALYRIRNAQIAEWYRALFPTDESSMTLKAFRDSFFQHFGVEQEQISLVNDNLVLRRTIDPQTLYGHDVIEDLCEINGVFGHIDAEGVFRYVSLQNMQTSDIPASEVENFEYQNYTARAIGRVTVRGTEADMGATYGSGENEYFVTGNIFALGRSSTELEQIAQRLSTRIFGVSYIPFSADVDGMRNMSLGRRFNIEGGLSTLDNLLVLEHELVGILAPHSTISAKGREEWREEKSSVESDIRVVSSQTNELTRTVEQTISKVETIEGDYVTNTEFLQNSTEVNLKLTEVDRELQKITEELDGDIKLYNLDYEPTLDNYPAWDFTENLKCALPGDPGYFECDEGVTFIYDDDSYRKHVRDLAYDETTATSYRFVREGNQYFWKQVADSEFGVAMAKIASLEASTEEIRQDVEEQRLVIDDQGARLETAEGELSVQSREISAKVSVQDGDATTACSWNMTPERFAIQSNGADVLKVTEAGLEVSGQGKFQGQVTGNIVKTRELTVGTDTKAYSRVGNASSKQLQKTARGLNSEPVSCHWLNSRGLSGFRL